MSTRLTPHRASVPEAPTGRPERDELTGLLSGYGFRALAEHELKVARRYRRFDAVLTLDLSGFHRINDALGEAAGDAALQETAQVLRATLRDSDIVARLDADRFAIYAPGSWRNVEGGFIAARLWDAFDAANVAAEAAGREYRLEAAIGVAALEQGDDLDRVVARADAVRSVDKSYRAQGTGPAAARPLS